MSRFFLILSLALSTSASAQELTAPEQKALIARLQSQRAEFPAMSGEFSEEKTTRLLTKPIVSSGEIAFLAPNKFRREIRGNSPSTTVCNGKELWIHYPKFNEAEHYTLGEKQFFDDSLAALTAGLNFDGVEKFFAVAAAKDSAGYRIVLTPRTASLRRILTALTVWLDAGGTIQKADATLPKGDRIVTTYKNLRPAKTNAAKFEFTPPPDVKVSTPLGK